MAFTGSAGRTYSEAQAASGRSAPTTAGEGVPLIGVKALYVTIEAESTRTLDGTGSLLGYIRDANGSAPAAWVRCPDFDLAVPSGASGLRRVAFSAFEVLCPRGEVLWATSSVGISAGTNVTVYVQEFDPVLTYSI